MLIESPIFINAFSKGGSNIIWNLFQTHPTCCSPIYETHEIFQRGKIGKIRNALFFLLNRQRAFFSFDNLSPRHRITKSAMDYLDRCLFKAKLENLKHEYNKYKTENIKYTYEEVKKSRLVCKNSNGIVFLTDILHEMYPDATFVALVRNGLALCEAYLSYGMVSSAVEFGKIYQKVTQKMIQDNRRLERYYIVKFEDIVNDPVKLLKLLYSYAKLDLNGIEKIRLKAKPHYNEKGNTITKYPSGTKVWLSFDQVNAFLDPNINEYQINKLSEDDKSSFMNIAHESMNYFSYE